ncbi:MAG: hydrogenase [Chloroflexi bacterium RBG_16_72_14]|nr:MAG: hydrogenase [Chloroflexi bacterium RBG_16_72_14]
MEPGEGTLGRLLVAHHVSRRAFLRFCSAMAAALALPPMYAPRIARALDVAQRVPVIWLEGQDCAGNTEGFLRASHPTVADLVLEILSVDYHETLMAPAGTAAERSRSDTVGAFPGAYIAVVEGGIPVAEGGVYCAIGGRSFRSIVEEVCGGALATIAVGTCAYDGGLPGANGGPTEAVGVSAIVPGKTIINLPGCPMNVQNLTATIVHYLTFGTFPAVDSRGRPTFAYGQLLHDQCERRAHFDAGEYVLGWGDEGHRKGWCLYKMGCKGPETFANCPTVRFNDRTSWPVKAGHGCVGCTMPRFWDQMSPFYRRLSNPPGFAVDVTADEVGLAFVGAVTGLTVIHGAASYARARRARASDEAISRPAGGPAGGPPPSGDGRPEVA